MSMQQGLSSDASTVLLSKGGYFTSFVEIEDSLSCHQSPPLDSIRGRIHCIPRHHITFQIIFLYYPLINVLIFQVFSFFKIWNYNVVCLMCITRRAGPALPLLSDNNHYVRTEIAVLLARLQQDRASNWLIENVINLKRKLLGHKTLLRVKNSVQLPNIIIIIIIIMSL
jgi:hypothetical protein